MNPFISSTSATSQCSPTMSLSWIEYVYFEKKDLEGGNIRGLKKIVAKIRYSIRFSLLSRKKKG